MAQVFSLRDSLEGATRGAAGVASMDQYASGVKRQNTIDDLAQSASGGGEQEIKRFAAMDPAGAANLISVINGMDKIEKDKRKSANEEVAKAVIFAEQGQTPEEKAARWDQGMQFLSQVIPEAAKDVGQYSPEKSQQYLMRAMSLDDLLEDSEKGEIKPGLDEKGNPVWTVIDAKKATSRVVKGEGGRESRRPPTHKPESGGGMKTADANAIYKRSAELFGGVFDAQGNLIKLDPETQPKVLKLAKRAERLFKDANGSLTHSEAADKAAQEMGITQSDNEAKAPPAIKDYLEKQRLK